MMPSFCLFGLILPHVFTPGIVCQSLVPAFLQGNIRSTIFRTALPEESCSTSALLIPFKAAYQLQLPSGEGIDAAFWLCAYLWHQINHLSVSRPLVAYCYCAEDP